MLAAEFVKNCIRYKNVKFLLTSKGTSGSASSTFTSDVKVISG